MSNPKRLPTWIMPDTNGTYLIMSLSGCVGIARTFKAANRLFDRLTRKYR